MEFVIMNTMTNQIVVARIVQGHRVASGQNGDPRFPGGTLRMQTAHFQARGFDISSLYPATLNVSVAPLGYRVVKAHYTFRQVKWHPKEPAEDFSFFDVRVIRPDAPSVAGFIYYPHPDTKPEHFQQPDVLELLLPLMNDIHYGAELRLEIPVDQMVIETLPSQPASSRS
jgi:hypothetical protein